MDQEPPAACRTAVFLRMILPLKERLRARARRMTAVLKRADPGASCVTVAALMRTLLVEGLDRLDAADPPAEK